MKQATKGKMPISQKSTANSDFAPSQDTGLFRVSAALQKEIAEKGFVFRWISRRDFATNGNFHKNDWMPYKSDSLKQAAEEFSFGSNPDGYLIRQEMVLAVKKKELRDAHKARLQRKNELYSSYEKQAAQELKQTLQGTGAQVYEGYERNGAGDSDDE